jgi:hypothetical protein
MGRIRNLLPHELQARIDQIPKSDIEGHKTAEGKKFLQENGYTLESWNRMVTQLGYAGELSITIKELRALQKDDLINYIEQVLEHGLLKPTSIEEEDWELHWSEKMLFKNLKVSQLKELPQKYQSLLGFKEGKRTTKKERKEIKKQEETWWDRFDGDLWFGRICIGIFVLLLLSLCMGPAPEGFKCSDSNLTSSQQRVCDKNFEDAYEKKWGRKPW